MTHAFPWRYRLLLPLGLAILTMAGCKSTPPAPVTEPVPIPVEAPKGPAQLFAEAGRSTEPLASQLYLQAALAWWEAQATDQVLRSLHSVDVGQLGPADSFSYYYLEARLALDALTLPAAGQALALAIPSSLEQQKALLRLQADYFLARQRPAQAAPALIELSALRASRIGTDLDALQPLHDEIWHLCQQTTTTEVRRQLQTARDQEGQGWWQLCQQVQQAFDRRELQLLTRQWLAQHAWHPAALVPPAALQHLQTAGDGPGHIALLLPTSGPLASAGQAVRDGFLAGYYASGARQRLTLLDTGSAPATARYEEALALGADLIIGPLDRNSLTALHRAGHFPKPLLALNALLDDSTPMPGLYQFSMAMEHEALALAEQLIRDGHFRALLVQAGDDWSQRASQAFDERYTSLGGTLLASDFFASHADITPVIGALLLVADSQERHRELARLLGSVPEFEPRRRQDVDALVALINGPQARSINSALAHHLASDLPVYSSSQATQDVPVRAYADLNQFYISQLPWRLQNSGLKAQIQHLFPASQGEMDSLYAFGLDAFRLADRLDLMTADNGRLHGATGSLYFDQHGRIQRELVWTQMLGGRLQPLRER